MGRGRVAFPLQQVFNQDVGSACQTVCQSYWQWRQRSFERHTDNGWNSSMRIYSSRLSSLGRRHSSLRLLYISRLWSPLPRDRSQSDIIVLCLVCHCSSNMSSSVRITYSHLPHIRLKLLLRCASTVFVPYLEPCRTLSVPQLFKIQL